MTRDAAPGEAGEICAKGPQVMKGYWRKPHANAAAFTPTAISAPAISACSIERRLPEIVDRKKDMIIVSGFNVYPNEIEAVAAACPGVAECACVGRPDEKTGEAVRLFVSRLPGADADRSGRDRALPAASSRPTRCRRRCASSTLLPKSNVGKILRKDLRDLMREAQ